MTASSSREFVYRKRCKEKTRSALLIKVEHELLKNMEYYGFTRMDVRKLPTSCCEKWHWNNSIAIKPSLDNFLHRFVDTKTYFRSEYQLVYREQESNADK